MPTATNKPTTKQLVDTFIAACKANGFAYSTRGKVVTISTVFTKGDREAYVTADMTAGDVLSLVPARGGSVWGTTSDGVGGYCGRENGYYRLNKSGCAKRFTTELIRRMSSPMFNAFN